jgi:hypothetical protein
MIGFALVRIGSPVTRPYADIRLFATRRLREKAFREWGKAAGWEEQDIAIEDAA